MATLSTAANMVASGPQPPAQDAVTTEADGTNWCASLPHGVAKAEFQQAVSGDTCLSAGVVNSHAWVQQPVSVCRAPFDVAAQAAALAQVSAGVEDSLDHASQTVVGGGVPSQGATVPVNIQISAGADYMQARALQRFDHTQTVDSGPRAQNPVAWTTRASGIGGGRSVSAGEAALQLLQTLVEDHLNKGMSEQKHMWTGIDSQERHLRRRCLRDRLSRQARQKYSADVGERDPKNWGAYWQTEKGRAHVERWIDDKVAEVSAKWARGGAR